MILITLTVVAIVAGAIGWLLRGAYSPPKRK